MRWGILLFVVLLAGCQAPSENTDEACSSPPEMASAADLDFSDPEGQGRVLLRVDSDAWSPHTLWVDVLDADGELVTGQADSGSIHQPNAAGVLTWSPDVEPEGLATWDVVVTDPEGCEGFGSFDVTGL